MNPFLSLPFVSAFGGLGPEFSDEVKAAVFPQHRLRYRNNQLLPLMAIETASDEDFSEAFGKFAQRQPLLAMRYHGYQFGSYNPNLGDGRGFLYGQLRGQDGELYDLGTKGSGMTPYARGADGRLTLKGGVREVLATVTLERLGVFTSRTLSLVETGEALWRGDEPSPTRSSVLVRFSRSHIRFGTFERLHHLNRPDLVKILLDHVIEFYYPGYSYGEFWAELVARVARLAAQWMVAGFCHGVLNTDNMSITGESFDYGPYAFINTFDPTFTAAYFDYYGRYRYGQQPAICKLNLEMLQRPLAMVIPEEVLADGLIHFDDSYYEAYHRGLAARLGLVSAPLEFINLTIQLLFESQTSYPEFFAKLTEQFKPSWCESLPDIELTGPEELVYSWKTSYQLALKSHAPSEVKTRLQDRNSPIVPLRSEIERVWSAIDLEDNWQPFYSLLAKIQS